MASDDFIFIVDDNVSDIELVKFALEESHCSVRMTSALNGELAIRMLGTLADDPAQAKPRVIILDLNMPKSSGREVLSFISQSSALKHIPVVMLTTSDSIRDRDWCMANGAYRYIVKAHRLQDFIASLSPVVTLLCPPPKPPDRGSSGEHAGSAESPPPPSNAGTQQRSLMTWIALLPASCLHAGDQRPSGWCRPCL
jgi:CheY-like chemotaxis protein